MLPKVGTELHGPGSDQEFATLIARSLKIDLGKTHQAIKTVMRWTGASERTVKHWLAGTHVPSGLHLLELMRHSDTLLRQILVSAGRTDFALALEVTAVRTRLTLALAACEDILEIGP